MLLVGRATTKQPATAEQFLSFLIVNADVDWCHHRCSAFEQNFVLFTKFWFFVVCLCSTKNAAGWTANAVLVYLC